MYSKNTTHFLDYKKHDGETLVFNLSVQHTIIKKFDLIFNQVNKILEMDEDFYKHYDEFLTIIYNYVENDDKSIDFEKIKELLPLLCDKIDHYAEQLDYWKFSYVAPKKISEYKLHIDANGYLEIMKASVRSKFFCVPVIILRERDASLIRYIYNYICREMIESGVQFKLERIIDSIVMGAAAYGMDAKSQLWTFFSTAKGLDPQNLALRERNALMYKALPTIATGLNPINWFVSCSRTSVKFQMKDKINEISISFNAPIESTYENSVDMLKVFIYEEITSNRKFHKLFKEFPFALNMISDYVFPITNWIAAPFISKVFNVSNLNITHLINILLLNIFTYKFLKDQENNWMLFRLLTYKASVKNDVLTSTGNIKFPVPKTSLYSKSFSNIFTNRTMVNIINEYINKFNTPDNLIYSVDQLRELFKKAIKSLLLYEYYNSEGAKMIIDPIEITYNYVEYIYNLLNGKYDKVIEEARDFLRED